MPGIADFLRGMFMPPQAQAPMNSLPNGAAPGTIMRGPDGQNFQFAETTGMQGATGSQGWIPTSMAPTGGNPLAALTQWNTDNPGVLSSIGAGMMSGDMGAGFSEAGKYRALAQAGQKEKAEKTRTNNLTRQWLMAQRGLSEADADAAIANPAILTEILKPAPKPSYMSLGDGYALNENDGSIIAGPNAGPKDDFSARRKAAAELGMAETDPAYQGYVLTGKMPKEDQQSLTAADKKAIWAAEDTMPALDNTLESLKRARELSDKIYTGYGAYERGEAGSAMADLPIVGGLVDKEQANATQEFSQLMSLEAVTAMSQTLKGATTDTEMARFMQILANPKTPADTKKRTIDRLITLAEAEKRKNADRINELRGGGIGSQTVPGAGGGFKTKSGVTVTY